MHAPSIYTDSKPARLYRYLSDRHGQWVDAWELFQVCQSTALSTHISAIRQRVPLNELVEHRRDGDRNYYRLRWDTGQMEMAHV